MEEWLANWQTLFFSAKKKAAPKSARPSESQPIRVRSNDGSDDPGDDRRAVVQDQRTRDRHGSGDDGLLDNAHGDADHKDGKRKHPAQSAGGPVVQFGDDGGKVSIRRAREGFRAEQEPKEQGEQDREPQQEGSVSFHSKITPHKMVSNNRVPHRMRNVWILQHTLKISIGLKEGDFSQYLSVQHGENIICCTKGHQNAHRDHPKHRMKPYPKAKIVAVMRYLLATCEKAAFP